jgi:hypothetical protein
MSDILGDFSQTHLVALGLLQVAAAQLLEQRLLGKMTFLNKLNSDFIFLFFCRNAMLQ